MTIGQTFTRPGSTALVVGFNNEPDGGSDPQEGKRYAALQVKVCVDAGGEVGPGAWSLVGTDGGFYNTYVSGGGLLQPGYDGTTVAPAGCATGWITFDLPQATQVIQARYTPTDEDGNQVIALWTLT